MISFRPLVRVLVIFGLLAVSAAPTPGHAQEKDTIRPPLRLPGLNVVPQSQKSDVPYVPTSTPVVNQMLELANVDSSDVVYDLGSGDGRIVIQAARTHGARGVGIEIDPELVKEARMKARRAGVSDLVEFRQGDLFETNISEATAVTLYLLPSVNKKLRPKLFRQLEPGTPVVSHDFDMGKWLPEETVKMEGDTVYLWTIPEEVPEQLEEDEQ